jgi:hypothetical protein
MAAPDLPSIYQALLKILAIINALIEQRMPKKSRIKDWATIIQKHEGHFEGSRSFRNHNPGNIKFGPYAKMLGAYGKDDKDFARFYSYEEGFAALCQYLRDAAGWYLIPYRQYAKKIGKTQETFTLLDFFNVYAPPSDNNDSNRYADVVAEHLGVSVDTPIKTLL